MDDLKLAIDPSRLDEEWLRQSEQVHTWAIRKANAQCTIDIAKSKLDLVRAKLDQDIRSNPESFGLAKITESSVANIVIMQPEYQIALKNLNEAKHRGQLAEAAMEALQHRKRALTLLVELWIRDYYSTPVPKTEDEKRQVRRRGRQRVEDEREPNDS